ncbi:hypothetical protein KLEP174_gp58 [Pseudomonas phage vB_PcuM_ KLEP17-4]|nr:hypothetical protein KLEP174_gp58 [Pseudomonas phage vB_PcuM_ KLEP17-4]
MRNNTAFFFMACLLTFALAFVLGVIGINPKHAEWRAIMVIADCIGLCCFTWGDS